MLPQELDFIVTYLNRAIKVQAIATAGLSVSFLAGILVGFPESPAYGLAAFCFLLAGTYMARTFIKALAAPEGGLLFLSIYLFLGGALSLSYLVLDLPVSWSMPAMSAASILIMYLITYQMKREEVIGGHDG